MMMETAISLSTRGHFRILKSGHFIFLLTHATTLNIKGESYRLKEKRKAGLLGRTPVMKLEPLPKTD